MSSINSIKTSDNNLKSTIIRVLTIIVVILAFFWLIMSLISDSSSSVLDSSTPISAKFQLMFWSFGGALLGGILGLRCLEKGSRFVHTLALVGLISGAVSLLLQLLMIWGLIPLVESSLFTINITVLGRLMIATLATAVAAIAVGLVGLIKDDGNSISLLKMVSTVCGIGFWAITIVLLFMDFSAMATSIIKALTMLGVMSSCFVVCSVAALILAWFDKKDKVEALLENKGSDGNNSQSSVNFGMGLSEDVIEKNVQARLAEEKVKAEREKMPPLQSDEMAPTVSRDNEVKIEQPVDLSAMQEPPKQ